MKPTRPAAVVALIGVLVGVLVALGILLGTAPVGAHGGEGQVEITSITRSGDDVTVAVRLTYVEDGHGVPDATLTVVVGDGTPVPMEPGAEEGDYQATVPAAEGAAIRVTSVEPATTAEGTAPPAQAETTTTAAAETTTTAAGTTTDPSSAPEDGAPLDDEDVPEPNALDEEPEDGNGNLIVIAVVAVVVVAAIVAAIVLRRKPKATPDGGTP